MSAARSEIAGHFNEALKSSDIVAICHAIGETTRLHNVHDIGFSRRTPLGRVMSGRVNLVTLLAGRSLPDFPDKQTFSESGTRSETCHEQTWPQPSR
jgi:hypothetical protein